MDEKKVWKILGIEKTSDEEAIREAYREALLHTNPEDDPEGFKALREAYERAVYIAAHGDEGKESNAEASDAKETPIGILIGKAEEIYADIRTRRDLSCWEAWAEDPLIQGLDTVDAVRQEFLLFCEWHYLFPPKIWRFFDRVFRICDELSALLEVFPENFIRFLQRSITEEDYFTYDEVIDRDELDFAPVTEIPVEAESEYNDEADLSDTDKYLRNVTGLYHIYGALQNKYTPEEEIPKLLDNLASRIIALRASEIYHPFEMIGLLRYLDFTDRNEEGLPVALHFLTPESIPELDFFSLANLGYFLANSYYKLGKDPAEIAFVLDAFDQVLSKEPHYVLANYGKSIYYFMTEDYDKADEAVLLAAEFSEQNKCIERFVDLVDERLLQYHESRLAENPKDIKSAIEAGWCYLRKNDTKRTMELLNSIVPDAENEYVYYNLYARCFVRDENFKEAEPHLLKWQEYLLATYEKSQRVSPDELTTEEKKQLERLSYSYYLLALCRKERGDIDGALEMMDLGTRRAVRQDEKVRTTFVKGQMLHEAKRYDVALDLWNEMIEQIPEFSSAYMMRQEAAFYERNAQQVIQDFWKLTEMAPEYRQAYVYAAKVYNAYERGDLFDEMMEVAEKNGIDSMALSYEKARRLMLDKEYEPAHQIFHQLFPDIDSEACDIEDKSDFYYDYGRDVFNVSKDPKYADEKDNMLQLAMMLTEKAIAENDHSRKAHWLKTDILEMKNEDATEAYETMLRIFPYDADVFYEYGRYLVRRKKKREAVKLFKETARLNPDHRAVHEKLSDYYLDRYYNTEKQRYYKQAVDHSLRQIENYANAYYYVSLGLVYMDGYEFDKALEAGQKAAEEEPNDAYAYNVIGYSLMMLKRYAEAEEAFNKGNQLLAEHPVNMALQRNFIRFLEQRGRYREAIDYAKAYYGQFHLDNTDTHGTLARLYKADGDYESAIRELDIVFKYYRRGAAGKEPEGGFIGAGDFSKQYPRADIETMSYIVVSQVKKIETLFIMGKKEECERLYQDLAEYIRRDEFKGRPRLAGNGKVQRRRNMFIASIYRELGRHEMYVRRDFDAAIKHLEFSALYREASVRASERSYLLGKTRLELAEALMRAGRAKEAREAAEKCFYNLIEPHRNIEEFLVYPASKPLRYSEIAKYYYFMGDREKAEELLGTMLDFPPCSFCRETECYDRFLTLANILEMSGDIEQALKAYRRALEISSTDAELYVAIDTLEKLT
ncbi:MAG: tetratricopeptide repeat protein [Eubacterium sp.]|nr:tetratricopeptide repeat protein [Eubacterium sp.]